MQLSRGAPLPLPVHTPHPHPPLQEPERKESDLWGSRGIFLVGIMLIYMAGMNFLNTIRTIVDKQVLFGGLGDSCNGDLLTCWPSTSTPAWASQGIQCHAYTHAHKRVCFPRCAGPEGEGNGELRQGNNKQGGVGGCRDRQGSSLCAFRQGRLRSSI
jgi:hypothetical protein